MNSRTNDRQANDRRANDRRANDLEVFLLAGLLINYIIDLEGDKS